MCRSTATNLSERVKLDLLKQILNLQLQFHPINRINITILNKKRVLTKPVISSMKLTSI